MNSIRYMAHHNPQPAPPNDAENRRLCWVARHAETAEERLVARNELLIRCQELIRRAARRLAARSILPFDDLVSEGQLGLIHAVSGFDFERDTPFEKYAKTAVYRWIHRAVLEQGGIVTIKARSWYARSSERMRVNLDRACAVLSIDAPFGENARLANLLAAPEPDRDPSELRDAVAFLMSRLSARDQVIVSLYFGLGGEPPLTDYEIAELVKLTREATRVRRHNAIARMAVPIVWKGVAG